MGTKQSQIGDGDTWYLSLRYSLNQFDRFCRRHNVKRDQPAEQRWGNTLLRIVVNDGRGKTLHFFEAWGILESVNYDPDSKPSAASKSTPRKKTSKTPTLAACMNRATNYYSDDGHTCNVQYGFRFIWGKHGEYKQRFSDKVIEKVNQYQLSKRNAGRDGACTVFTEGTLRSHDYGVYSLDSLQRASVAKENGEDSCGYEHGCDQSPTDYDREMVVKNALEDATERQRQVWELIEVHGLTQADVAVLLGITQATVSEHHKAAGAIIIAYIKEICSMKSDVCLNGDDIAVAARMCFCADTSHKRRRSTRGSRPSDIKKTITIPPDVRAAREFLEEHGYHTWVHPLDNRCRIHIAPDFVIQQWRDDAEKENRQTEFDPVLIVPDPDTGKEILEFTALGVEVLRYREVVALAQKIKEKISELEPIKMPYESYI